MKTACFGGSFNPPHVGHVLAATYALSVGFDQVFVPVVKQHAFQKSLAAFHHRVQMARLAFEPSPRVVVSELEAELPAPNFTLQTVKFLRERHPDWQLRLLVGSDVLPELPSWHDPEQLLRLAPLYPLTRAGYEQTEQSPPILPQISSSDVRARLRARETDWLRTRVPKAVLEYIDAHGLYT